MNPPPTGTEVSPAHSQELLEEVQRLESITDVQAKRIQSLIDQAERTTELEATAQQMIKDAEEEKRNWTKQRDRQIAELQEDCEQLAAAWTRLEEQQRRLLAREATAERAPTRMVGSMHSAALAASAAVTATPLDDDHDSRQEAIRQFQQLRREIGKHAQTR